MGISYDPVEQSLAHDHTMEPTSENWRKVETTLANALKATGTEDSISSRLAVGAIKQARDTRDLNKVELAAIVDREAYNAKKLLCDAFDKSFPAAQQSDRANSL
jgi:hypothetical protein